MTPTLEAAIERAIDDVAMVTQYAPILDETTMNDSVRLALRSLVEAVQRETREEDIKAQCLDCRRSPVEHHPEWGWVHRRGLKVVDCEARHIRTAAWVKE